LSFSYNLHAKLCEMEVNGSSMSIEEQITLWEKIAGDGAGAEVLPSQSNGITSKQRC
jgi:hypothetical protein